MTDPLLGWGNLILSRCRVCLNESINSTESPSKTQHFLWNLTSQQKLQRENVQRIAKTFWKRMSVCVGTWPNRQQSDTYTRLPCFQMLLPSTSGNRISGRKPFLVVEVGKTPKPQKGWARAIGPANQKSPKLLVEGIHQAVKIRLIGVQSRPFLPKLSGMMASFLVVSCGSGCALGYQCLSHPSSVEFVWETRRYRIWCHLRPWIQQCLKTDLPLDILVS